MRVIAILFSVLLVRVSNSVAPQASSECILEREELQLANLRLGDEFRNTIAELRSEIELLRRVVLPQREGGEGFGPNFNGTSSPVRVQLGVNTILICAELSIFFQVRMKKEQVLLLVLAC